MVWQGKENAPHSYGDMFPFAKFWAEHRRDKSTSIITVEIDESKADEVARIVSELGGRITSRSGQESLARRP
jgi:hypothetical protein